MFVDILTRALNLESPVVRWGRSNDMGRAGDSTTSTPAVRAFGGDGESNSTSPVPPRNVHYPRLYILRFLHTSK